jgi:hypothetical protein
MDLTRLALFALAAVVVGWFALGIVWNIRRGNAVLKWMQRGLPRLGDKTTLRWLGSSVVELGIAKARSPFRRVEIVLVLEPRDVPWFWVFARLNRRRDMLIIRGQLAAAPQYEFDLVAPGSWSERLALGQARSQAWPSEPLAGLTFAAPAATRSLSRPLAQPALATARQVQPVVWRLSARREFPQLELHTPLPDPARADPAQFFEAVCGLARLLSAPHES